MKGLKTYFTFLNKNKMFTLVNMGGLSISLMFVLLIANMVSRQLSIDKEQPDASRIYAFGNEQYIGSHYLVGEILSIQYPEIEDWCAVSNLAYTGTYVLQETRKVELKILASRNNFFQFFYFKLLSGRPDQVLTDKNSIVLTENGARKLFGNEPAIGKALRLSANSQETYTVTGIMKNIDNSLFPSDIEAIVPYDFIDYIDKSSSMHERNMNNAGGATVFARFHEGTNPNDKATQMLDYLKKYYWIYALGYMKEVKWVSMHDFHFSEIPSNGTFLQYSFTKVVIFICVGILILLMAVFNYISMSVAQTSYRAKEMATRRLLGSSRPDIFWRMIAESFLLTLGAFLLAFLLARAVEPFASDLLQVNLDLTGDLNILTLSIYLAGILLLSLLAGFVPATLLSRYNPLDIVKGNFRRKTKVVYLRGLYITQSSLTLAMLTCAIYLSIQLYNILHEPLGYSYGNILNYPALVNKQKLQTFRDKARTLPFVNKVCFTQGTPADLQGENNAVQIYNGKGEIQNIRWRHLTADSTFIHLFHLNIINNHLPVTEETTYFFSDSVFNALGLSHDADYLRSSPQMGSMHYPVAGTFKDIKSGSILDTQYPTMLSIMHPDSIYPWNILIEVTGNELTYYKKELDKLYSETIEGIPFESEWYHNQVKAIYKDLTNLQHTIGIFTGAALLISLLGLTAMSLYFIAQRKRDMAIRKVFGSSSRQEMKRLIQFAFSSLVISIIIALPLAYIGIMQINRITHYQSTMPWLSGIIAFITVTAISLGSVYLISRNATRENPIKNLKTE